MLPIFKEIYTTFTGLYFYPPVILFLSQQALVLLLFPGICFGTEVSTYEAFLPTAVNFGFEHADVRETAVFAVEVEAIADDVLVLNRKPVIIYTHIHFALTRFVEQCAHTDTRGFSRAQVLDNVAEPERPAGVDDILDDQHVLALDALVQVLQKPHHAG